MRSFLRWSKKYSLITTHKRNLRRLCFYTCLSVHRGEYLGRYPPWQVHPPWQVPPQEGTPPGQVHPLGRYTHQAGTPHWQVHPSWAGTPPGQVTPPWQVHLPGQVHPPCRYPPSGSSACWEIRATSGRYASYWNAFLLQSNIAP